jgi:hypothetical protein
MAVVTLYHGSQQRIEHPTFGYGSRHNDYGVGFYCTQSLELAKEWACPEKCDGYANRYTLDTAGLTLYNLQENPYGALGWLTILLKNRNFDTTAELARRTKEYLLQTFLPEVQEADVIICQRADDSYFMYARDFLNGQLSLRGLEEALFLGNLGEQVVLMTSRAFASLLGDGYEPAPWAEYFYKREGRDLQARDRYQEMRRMEFREDDVYAFDIYRERMRPDDPRLRTHHS